MIQFITVCPECQHPRVRTDKVFDEGKWKWLNGCNKCTWQAFVGNVGDE